MGVILRMNGYFFRRVFLDFKTLRLSWVYFNFICKIRNELQSSTTVLVSSAFHLILSRSWCFQWSHLLKHQSNNHFVKNLFIIKLYLNLLCFHVFFLSIWLCKLWCLNYSFPCKKCCHLCQMLLYGTELPPFHLLFCLEIWGYNLPVLLYFLTHFSEC